MVTSQQGTYHTRGGYQQLHRCANTCMIIDSGSRCEVNDINLEAITDVLWSADLSGHSTGHLISAGELPSTDLLIKSLDTACVTGVPKTMATPRGGETLQSARHSNPALGFAARCHIFLVKNPRGTKSTKAQSQPENIQACSSVNFQYSAQSPAANDPLSATNRARQRALAKQVYGRNTTSYLHFLKRKIKLITSKADSYCYEIQNNMSLIISELSSYACDFYRKIQLVNYNKNSYADLVREIQQLKVDRDSFAHELDTRIGLLKDSHADALRDIEFLKTGKDSSAQFLFLTAQVAILKAQKDLHSKVQLETLHGERSDFISDRRDSELSVVIAHAQDLEKHLQLLNTKKNSYVDDLDKQIQLLCGRRDTYAHVLIRQIQLLNARKKSHVRHFSRTTAALYDKVALYGGDLDREYKLLQSKMVPFVHVLERQLKMLDSKLDSCNHEYDKKHKLLESNKISHFLKLDKKVKLLTRDVTFYLGKGMQLQN